MLSEKEKKDIEGLPKKFNINHEATDYNFMASNRSDFSREMSRKLLRGAIFLNIMSLVFVVLTGIVHLTKPSPKIYVSTPSGKVYNLPKLN